MSKYTDEFEKKYGADLNAGSVTSLTDYGVQQAVAARDRMLAGDKLYWMDEDDPRRAQRQAERSALLDNLAEGVGGPGMSTQEQAEKAEGFQKKGFLAKAWDLAKSIVTGSGKGIMSNLAGAEAAIAGEGTILNDTYALARSIADKGDGVGAWEALKDYDRLGGRRIASGVSGVGEELWNEIGTLGGKLGLNIDTENDIFSRWDRKKKAQLAAAEKNFYDKVGEVNNIYSAGQRYRQAQEQAYREEQNAKYAESPAAQNIYKYGTMVGTQLPNMALSIAMAFTGNAPGAAAIGGGLAPATTQGLQWLTAFNSSSKARQLGMMAANSAKAIASSPQYWSSVAMETGSAYNEATEAGVDPNMASAYALSYGLLSGVIEVGGADEAAGGIEKLPKKIREAIRSGNKAGAAWEYAKSILGEIGEEEWQEMLSNVLKGSVLGEDVPLYSTTDENAVINPGRMAQTAVDTAITTALMGAGERAIIGGAQSIADNTQYRGDSQVLIDAAKRSEDEATVLRAAELDRAAADRKSGSLKQKEARELYNALGEGGSASGAIQQESVRKVLSDSDMDVSEVEAVMSGYGTGETNATAFVYGVREAYSAGKKGLSETEARERASFADGITEKQFEDAWKLGALGQEDTADISTEEGRANAVTRLSPVLGEHAEEAVDLYEPWQSLARYTSAMEKAINLRAAGDVDLKEIRDKAKFGGKAGALTYLTDAQIEKAQELGTQLRAEQGRITENRAEALRKVRDKAAQITQAENVRITEVNTAIHETTALIRNLEQDAEGMEEGLRLARQAQPGIENTEEYREAENRLEQEKEQLKEAKKALNELRKERSRVKLRSKDRRKKGTVSFDGGEIEGRKVKGIDRSKLSREQKKGVAAVEAVADAVDLDFVLFDGETGTGGAYIQGGTIYVNVNASIKAGDLRRNIMAATLSHELTHFMQQYAPEEYQALKDFVIREILKAGPEELNRLVENERRWHSGNKILSYDEALDEVVANACQTMLFDSKAIRKLARENMTLAEKIADVIEEISERIRAAFEDIDTSSHELFRGVRDISGELEQVQALWDSGIEAAARQRQAERIAGTKNTATEGDEVQYQKTSNDYDSETATIKQQLDHSASKLAEMPIAATKNVPYFRTGEKSKAAAWAIKELKSKGYHADKPGYGRIYFTEKDIDQAARYADTPAEKGALSLVYDVVKRGIEIGRHEDHDSRGKRTITFAAPVVLNGVRGNMAVVVNQRSNHFYAERIVLPNGSAFVLPKIKETPQELPRGVAQKSSLAEATSSASENSIADVQQAVKGNNTPAVAESMTQMQEWTEDLPKQTQYGFKLMNVDEDGLPHAMFIDAAKPYRLGQWYTADAPGLKELLEMEPGYAYLVDGENNIDVASRKKLSGSKSGLPSKSMVNRATQEGKRWMTVTLDARGKKSVANVGINGSGGVTTFAMRPGIHAVDIPSMTHIGEKANGSEKINSRRANQAWFLIEYPVDQDYNQEAFSNQRKDIRDHLPEKGWYSFQTNSGAEASQHWFITGGMKIVGMVREEDARKYARDHGFAEDLPWLNGKNYSEDSAINLEEYIRTAEAQPTPSKDEMRRRIEAGRQSQAGEAQFMQWGEEDAESRQMELFDVTRSDMHPRFRARLESAVQLTEEVKEYLSGKSDLSEADIESAMDLNLYGNVMRGDMAGADLILQELSEASRKVKGNEREQAYLLMEKLIQRTGTATYGLWLADNGNQVRDRQFARWYKERHPSLYYPGYRPGDLFETRYNRGGKRSNIQKEKDYLHGLIESGKLQEPERSEARDFLRRLNGFDGSRETFYQKWEEMSAEEQQAEINATMTMEQAKRMVQKAYVAGLVRDWYPEYKNGDEWLKGQGSSDVAEIIENDGVLYNMYIGNNPHLVEYDFTIEEVIDAYAAGTLTGPVRDRKQRVDTSRVTGYRDSRFYSNAPVEADVKTWDLANSKVTKSNRDQVNKARKDVLLAAHNADIPRTFGITTAELNKKLRSWSRYSANARDASIRINQGVAPENQWAGIQNSSILSTMNMTDEDIRSMVREIDGEATQYERNYIGNAMLALDTHIDWSWLSFRFVPGHVNPNRKTVLGYYENTGRYIAVGGRRGQNTVSHEMGHALDYQWERELFGGKSSQPLTENTFDESNITDDDGRTFYRNFRAFVQSLTDSGAIHSSYAMEPRETFARFVAKFVEWTQVLAGSGHITNEGYSGDKFTAAQFIEFARLLQEKAAWDSKRAVPGAQFQQFDDTYDDTDSEAEGREGAYGRLLAENKIMSETVKELRKAVRTQDGTISGLLKRFVRTNPGSAQRLANSLKKRYGSTVSTEELAGLLEEVGNYFLQTKAEKLSEEHLKNLAREAARVVAENAEAVEEDPENEVFRSIRNLVKSYKLVVSADEISDTEYASLSEFRKAVNWPGASLVRSDGKHVTPEHIGVDSFYEELRSTYGENYFPELTNQGEMLVVIAQNCRAAEPIRYNPFEQYMGEVVEDIANTIVMRVMEENALRPFLPAEALEIMDRMNSAEGENKDLKNRLTEAMSRGALMKEELEALRAAGQTEHKELLALRDSVYELTKALREAGEQYSRLNEEAERRLVQVREEGAARVAAAIAKERERASQKVKALKEHYADIQKRARERREESASVTKYRAQVTEKAGKLYTLLEKNDNKAHVPEVLKGPLAEFLTELDFSSKRLLRGGNETRNDQAFGARIQRLQQLLSGQQDYLDGNGEMAADLGGYIDVSQDSLDFLRRTAELITQAMAEGRAFTVNQMSGAQLKDLSNLLSNLYTAIRNMNDFMANARFQTVREAASRDVSFFRALGKAGERAGNRLRNWVVWRDAVPYYAFKRYGEGGQSIFDGFARGWEKLAFNAKEIIDFTENLYTDKEVAEWTAEMHEFTLDSGETIRMTTAQIMELSMLLNREQARQHTEHGGIRIGTIRTRRGTQNDTEHYHMSQSELRRITGTLTQRQLEVAKALQHFMAVKGAEWGNEISMRRFGYRFYTEGENYYPIKTDPNDRPMSDTDAPDNASMFRLLNLSSSKALNPKASNALVVGDIFDTFANHMSDMAKLNSMGLPVLDAIKWFNYKERVDLGEGRYDTRTLQKAMEGAYGPVAQHYFRTLMKDINGVVESGDRGADIWASLTARYKAVAVGANLRVALLQPTSYLRALTVLKPQYLAGAFASRNAYQEAMRYSGSAQWKALGYYDTDIQKGMRGQIKHNDSWRDKVVEISMKGAEFGDKRTWGRLWVACKMQTRAENRGLSSEELNRRTADLFREVIYSSQVMDSTLTRSEMMRSKSLGDKLLTPFMAEPTLTFNILMDAASQYTVDTRRLGKAQAWQQNSGRIGRAFAAFVLTAAFNALAESIWDAVRDDDDEEFWKKFNDALFGEEKKFLKGNLGQDLLIPNMIPGMKDVISMLSGYTNRNIATEGLENIINCARIWEETYRLATGELEKATKVTSYGKMTMWGKIYKSLQALSQLSGLPIYSATREAVAIWNTIMNGRRDDWKILTYDGNSLSEEKIAGWEEFVQNTGISRNQYKAILSQADVNGTVSPTQDEMGAYLTGALEAGELTEEQAQALWRSQWHKEKSKTFDKWREKNADGFSPTEEDTGDGEAEGAQTKAAAGTQAGAPKETRAGAQTGTQAGSQERTTTTVKQVSTVSQAGASSTGQTAGTVSSYDDFKKAAPLYDAKKKEASYNVWQSMLQPAGMSLTRFTEILTAADVDRNGSLKQDELGTSLRAAMSSGEMSWDAAAAVWNAQGWAVKHDLSWWISKN